MPHKGRSFNIRALDDGSFLLSISGEDLGKSEESSYDSVDEMLADIRTDLGGKKKVKKEENEDEPGRKAKAAVLKITKKGGDDVDEDDDE